MVRAGKALAAHGPPALQQAQWTVADVGARGGAGRPRARLLRDRRARAGSARAASLDHAWSLAGDTLAIIEPGTTAGYERVLAVRAAVIAAGGSTLAPCPHDAPCPLPEGDWCHFATRLARSRTHRLAKGAERGFEDEKFAYVVLTRSPHPARLTARVLRRPDLRPGTSCSTSAPRTASSAARSRSATGPTTAGRARSPGATRSDADICVTLAPCNGSRSSQVRRPGSARRPHALLASPGMALRPRRPPRRPAAQRWPRRQAAKPSRATSATALPSRRSPHASSSATRRSTRSSTTRACPRAGSSRTSISTSSRRSRASTTSAASG